MEPVYMNENRYAYMVGSWRPAANTLYVAEDPAGEFEQHLQELFLEGQAHLHHEEYTLALSAFEEAMALILHTVAPTMPVDPNQTPGFKFPTNPELLDLLIAKSVEILGRTPLPVITFPKPLLGDPPSLPAAVIGAIKQVAGTGLIAKSFHGAVLDDVTRGVAAADAGAWARAIDLYQSALDQTPAREFAIRGSLQHDLAILNEKADHGAKAQTLGEAAVVAFGRAKLPNAQAQALATAEGIYRRGGNAAKAKRFATQLDKLKATTNVHEVGASTPGVARAGAESRLRPMVLRRPLTVRSSRPPIVTSAPAPVQPESAGPVLMGTTFLGTEASKKALTIKGFATTATINVTGAKAGASMTDFYKTIAKTRDPGLLVGWLTPVQYVAYLPHMYFFVLPMSIADCYAGMGNLEDARDTYLSVLPYPFINKNLEIVKLWTRLAQSYLDLADHAYRNAKDDVASFTTAKAFYEKIVRADRSIDPASPLYADAKFASVKGRVEAFLNAADPTAVKDNPAILVPVLSALGKLGQIEADLNFFGFAPDYVPPFSFEYLQITARYFAQHASQTEQRYIQYKSQAENEEFRRDQLDQQAEVARQTVVLEQRGAAEAQAGVNVANASLAYADTQIQLAQAAKTEFNNVRWELLEYAELEAWSSAAAVDQDDEVQQTISGFSYYNTKAKDRSDVLADLAHRRTRITHDLEASRLDRAVTSAQSYRGVAQAQVAQAQARVAVAQQRVQIAQLQQRQAEENRDFLDMREFAARLWYELARTARRLTQRYLDMATESAFLMERAYNAETERNLSVIRYDYHSTASGNLMGADLLTADIDSFTFDYIATTKTKKNPVKTVVSLADRFPIQFHRLKQTGRCTFETTLGDFDRRHPGLYLAKVRNVEVVFVGIAGVEGVAGSLRNIGVSKFRSADGGVVTRLYPADVMVLSQYQIRQDALAFRVNPNDLRLFENNGLETQWQLDLPLDANDLDYGDILDVQIVLHYDGYVSATLEQQIRAALPTTGSASRAVSMRFSSPDELFYLKNKGEAELVLDATQFPRTQKNLVRKSGTILLGGTPATTANLKLRLNSDALGNELLLVADADGQILDGPGEPLADLRGQPVLDRWQLVIRADDNPQLAPGGVLDLSGLEDVMAFFEYDFDYR